MDGFTVLLVALGLAMDAFAVSVAGGLGMRRFQPGAALRMAFLFGFFQFAMPVAGWAGGLVLRGPAGRVDHWLAFGLLAAIGAKMIAESRKLERERAFDHTRLSVLLLLAVATSIDALAVGLSLSFLQVDIVGPALAIGGVTFVLSLAGVAAGQKVGHLFEGKIELAGGLVLIGIGLKILIEHLTR